MILDNNSDNSSVIGSIIVFFFHLVKWIFCHPWFLFVLMGLFLFFVFLVDYSKKKQQNSKVNRYVRNYSSSVQYIARKLHPNNLNNYLDESGMYKDLIKPKLFSEGNSVQRVRPRFEVHDDSSDYIRIIVYPYEGQSLRGNNSLMEWCQNILPGIIGIDDPKCAIVSGKIHIEARKNQ